MMLGELEHILLSLGKMDIMTRSAGRSQPGFLSHNCPAALDPACSAQRRPNIYTYFPISGEKLEREEVDILIKECCDPEDDDGFIPYERKC